MPLRCASALCLCAVPRGPLLQMSKEAAGEACCPLRVHLTPHTSRLTPHTSHLAPRAQAGARVAPTSQSGNNTFQKWLSSCRGVVM